MLPQRL